LHKQLRPAVVTLALMTLALGSAAQARIAPTTAALSKTYLLTATLDTRHEVPVPKDATGAKGVLTAKLVIAGKKSSLVWQLRFSGLSGRATASHLHFGAVGKAGQVAIPLCVPCTPSAHGAYNGPYVATPAFVNAILHGGMYANIHTKLNPKGEIRGQVTATAAG
jgi:hypothetical protein